MTYEPSIAVIAQGRKRVELGQTTFVYGETSFLLTSIDLPITSQVVEASPEVPFLALSLKLEMPVVREMLSRDEIPLPDTPPDTPAMSMGETTVEVAECLLPPWWTC
ncbi:MAG: AraC family transcriptional regulator [Paludibaculum sp.]